MFLSVVILWERRSERSECARSVWRDREGEREGCRSLNELREMALHAKSKRGGAQE